MTEGRWCLCASRAGRGPVFCSQARQFKVPLTLDAPGTRYGPSPGAIGRVHYSVPIDPLNKLDEGKKLVLDSDRVLTDGPASDGTVATVFLAR